jgi:hypothetical protein
MARRQQRRPFRQPRDRTPDRTREQAALEAGARRLLVAGNDAHSLQSMVNDLKMLRDDADRVAYEQPSPDALRSYRRAVRELAEAETALSLLT